MATKTALKPKVTKPSAYNKNAKPTTTTSLLDAKAKANTLLKPKARPASKYNTKLKKLEAKNKTITWEPGRHRGEENFGGKKLPHHPISMAEPKLTTAQAKANTKPQSQIQTQTQKSARRSAYQN